MREHAGEEMRDYRAVVRRIEALSRPYVKTRIVGLIHGYPIYAVRLVADDSLPVVYINGGTHGDEPAGVEGTLAFLERHHGEWLEYLQFEVIPCLNPYSYVHNRRDNRQGVDINWAFLRDDVPEILMVREFIHERRFEAVIDLHEDWESPGYYLYEQVRGMPPVGPDITWRVSKVCPLNTDETIENADAKSGVIFPDVDSEVRRKGEGIPVALFEQRYTDHLITSETPTEEPMETRVAAHLAALETVIEAHCPKASGGRAGSWGRP